MRWRDANNGSDSGDIGGAKSSDCGSGGGGGDYDGKRQRVLRITQRRAP